MKLKAMHGYLIGGVLLLAPSAVMAQDPTMPTNTPGMNPGSSSQPSAPGVKNSNSSVFGQDSSMNSTGGPDAAVLRDKAFLHEVAEGGVAELQLGQLAAQKASNDDVKKFGQSMVDDHTTLTDMMKPMASELGVKVPGKMDKADQVEYDKLKGLSGSDFDKEFLLYVVAEHRKTLRAYRDEVVATNDTDLKDAAMNSAKIVVTHTREAIKLAKANGVTLPSMAPPKPPKP